jgi:hypothetical protein
LKVYANDQSNIKVSAHALSFAYPLMSQPGGSTHRSHSPIADGSCPAEYDPSKRGDEPV